jgi:hypothetical protein
MRTYFKQIACAILALMTSCQSIRETHYFRDKAGNPPNYYRLQIKGYAFLTSSRYLSGNFDEEAVNYYFGEIAQAKDAKFNAVKSNQTSEEGIVPVGADGLNKKFVLLLSTNSDAISSAFGNFVESKETQKELARIINRDKLIELEDVRVIENTQEKKRQKMTALGDSYLNSITAAESSASIRIKLLAYLNSIADYFGSPQNFKDLATAEKWFKDNRNSLLN